MLPTLNVRRRRTEARELAMMLMAQHGLVGWTFGFNRRCRSMGLCLHRKRMIQLSMHFVDRNSTDAVRDTILHEIAHALVGSGHGHDAVWMRKAIEIGARPTRCGLADMPLGRWRGKCGGCGRPFFRHRRPRRMNGWFCSRCGPKDGTISWHDAGAGDVATEADEG